MSDFDVVIIGAGVVGLACAARLARSGRSVLVVDRNQKSGQETSSRNSGVIHAGIYYPPGSLKAKLCVRGRTLLYERCRARGIAHRRVGKLIVASDLGELDRLLRIQAAAEENGVTLDLLESRALSTKEPHVRGLAALWSKESGIVDAHELMYDYQAEAVSHDALFAFRTEVTALELVGEYWRMSTRVRSPSWDSSVPNSSVPNSSAPDSSVPDSSARTLDETLAETRRNQGDDQVSARWVVNAAGLFSDRIAELAGVPTATEDLKLKWCKGDYFALAPRLRSMISHLIYPLPSPAGLGVHLTLDLSGALIAGPDTQYVTTRDYELNATKAESFAAAIQRYFPAVFADDLTPAYSGIRPKLAGPGAGFRDFYIEHESCRPGLINLIGIESPGLTASGAIAERVEELLTNP